MMCHKYSANTHARNTDRPEMKHTFANSPSITDTNTRERLNTHGKPRLARGQRVISVGTEVEAEEEMKAMLYSTTDI